MSNESQSRASNSRIVRWLEKLGAAGNRLPDPLTLFVIFTVGVVVASVIFAGAAAEVVQRSGEVELKTVTSLLSPEGIRWMFTSVVDNFIGFAPLGPVLTVMIGIGVAEATGFISMGLKLLVRSVPRSAITATLVFGGVMSSMAADAGYVVLTPLGAMLFAGMGRHPLAGLAAAYAGVSGGFSANLLITGLDPMLAGLTQEAAQTIAPGYLVNATSNYYFMVASTVLITVAGTWVTTKFVEPMLGDWEPDPSLGLKMSQEAPTPRERRAFLSGIAIATILAAVFVLLAVVPGSPLRDPVELGDPAISALDTIFHGIEIIITILFIVPAIVYGAMTGQIENDKDVARMAAAAMATMGAYIVLAFIAGQFVAYFNWTNLGAVTAVRGAELLRDIGLQGFPLLMGFVIVAGSMNLFIGSASAKWAFMAPIFVPMLMMMGFSPELTQAAYRVGDSTTNIITPLMPYLPVIIVFAQKYDRKAGMGTIIAAMVPYSVAFFVFWSILLVIWYFAGIPLGPGAPLFYAPMAP